MENRKTGIVFDIQRCSLYDGPGIRTTIFLKGCPLRCVWCHNPESQRFAPEIALFASKCTGCGRCADVCPAAAHGFVGGAHRVDRALCGHCGACMAACPVGALRLYGEEMTARQVVNIARRDRSYYEGTGGGLTLSGGEPFAQYDFAVDILRQAKESGLHTCVETSGQIEADKLRAALPLVDTFLYDYKATGLETHRRLTGVDGSLILSNLRILSEAGCEIVLRCPLIPGYNDDDPHLRAIAAMERAYPALAGIEILPYHNMGAGKAEAIGNHYGVEAGNPDAGEKDAWRARLRACGCGDKVVSSFA